MMNESFLLGYGAGKANGGGGGGVTTESGSFTITRDNISTKTITHSLNTDKIFGIVYVKPDENDEVVVPGGYTILYGVFMSRSINNELFTGATLVEEYTSGTQTAVYQEQPFPAVTTMKSTWTNQNAEWFRSTLTSMTDAWAENATANSFDLKLKSTGTYFRAGITFYWRIWKMEGEL